MRKHFLTSIVCSLLLFPGANLVAQNEDDKIKIDITVVKDGETKTIKKEIDLSDADNLKKLMKQIDGLEDIDISVEDGDVEVIVRKKGGETEVRSFAWPSRTYYNMPSDSKVAYMGIVGTGVDSKVVLSKVIEDSPAAKAGFKEDDIILEFDGEKVDSYNALVELIHSKKSGDEVKVKVERDGKTRKLDLILGERKSYTVQWSESIDRLKEAEDELNDLFRSYEVKVSNKGFLGVHYSMDGDDGVVITKIVEGSAADDSGLQAEDVIIKVNGTALTDGQSFSEVMKGTKPGDEIEVEWKRDGKAMTKTIKLGERKSGVYIGRFNGNHQDFKFHFDNDNFPLGEKKEVMVKVLVERVTSEEEEMLHKALGISSSKDFGNIDLQIFPNPGDGKFNVSADIKDVDQLDIHVFDVSGNEVYSSRSNGDNGNFEKMIDISDQASGTYFLVIKSGERMFTEKILKK